MRWSLILLLAASPLSAADYPVANTNDEGTGSLRWAIELADTHPGEVSTITIETCGVVSLRLALPPILAARTWGNVPVESPAPFTAGCSTTVHTDAAGRAHFAISAVRNGDPQVSVEDENGTGPLVPVPVSPGVIPHRRHAG
jgi:hypothetical protein